MTDRFLALRFRSTLLAVAGTLCALAAPAVAQQRSVPVPADAPTVATTSSGAAVLAWVHGGTTCLAVQLPGAVRPQRLGYDGPVFDATAPVVPGGCWATPTLSRFDGEQLATSAVDDRTAVAWGWAGTQTARVQLKDGAAVVADVVTAPSPLPGPAGLLRFWAVDRANDATPNALAFLDAAGVVRRAIDPSVPEEVTDVEEGGIGGPPVGTLLQSGRAGAHRWQLRRVTSTVLRPTPLQPERRVARNCLRTFTRKGDDTAFNSGLCADEHDFDRAPLVVASSSDCDLGAQVTVLATAAVRRVVAILGDGRRQVVPLVAFGDGLRTGMGVVGYERAVRSVLALGADGRVLHTDVLGSPPVKGPAGSRSCPGAVGGLRGRRDAGDPPLGAGPHTVRYADHGVELCARADAAPRVPQDCAVPPTRPRASYVWFSESADGLFGFGVVGDEVAAARVTVADGTQRTVASGPLTGYTGIYAGVLRQIAIELPTEAGVLRRVELLDDRGRVLNHQAFSGTWNGLGRAIALLPAADGAPAVRAAPIFYGRRSGTCLASGVLATLDDCADFLFPGERTTGPDTVRVDATCTPRRLLVTGLLRRAGDRLAVRTTGGREIAATQVRIPSAAGDAGFGRFYARAILGPREGIDAVLLRGRLPARVPVGLPPAERQCGYADAAGVAASFFRKGV